jgi:hypothetical protein
MQSRDSNRLGRWLVAFACMALVASSSIALAAGGSSAKVTIAPNKVASATATCPKGKGVVAGGFGSPSFNPRNNGPGAVRIASKRVGKRKLETSGFNFGQQSGQVESLAYCAKMGLAVRVASEKTYVAPSSVNAAIATCPGRSEVIGGGFASPGFSPNGPQIVTLTSKRARKNQWRVEGYNTGDNGNGSSQDPHPGTLIAYAYCLDNPPKIVTRVKRANSGAMGAAKAVKVSCPHGMKALSGGFDGNIYLSANSNGAGAISSKRVGHQHSWRLSAVSISGKASKISAYAYCVPRHR